MMEMQSRHIAVGKCLLIICLLFSITIIGENSTYIPKHNDEFDLYLKRKKNQLELLKVEEKLNQYELTKKLPKK